MNTSFHNEEGVIRQPIFNSTNQAAMRLGIGRTKLYEMIGTGHLKAIKLHGRTLIAEDDLQRFADAVRNGEFSEVA